MTSNFLERSPHSFLRDPILWTILLIGLIIRLYLASTTTYIWDEEREFLPITQSISFSPGSLHLPMRTANHGALASYFIKAGSTLAGESILGFRLFSVFAGGLTVLVVALLAFTWSGREAALWSCALLAFNEYHVFVSILAIQKVFFLLFCSLAAYTFVLAMKRDQIRWLYLTATCTAIGFLCYEVTILLVPVFVISIIFSPYRNWLYRPELYLSLLVAVAVLSPDVHWNFFNKNVEGVSYADHLSRIGGLGFTRHYFLFFFRDLTATVYGLLDRKLYDPAAEYASMNSILGCLLFAGAFARSVSFAVHRRLRSDSILLFLLLSFWLIFCFFLIIRPGDTPGMDGKLWLWVDVIIVPGAILAGSWASQSQGKWRHAILLSIFAGFLYSTYATVATRFDVPSRVVAFDPEVILSSNGDFVEVEAVFNHCFLCDSDPKVELVDIAVVRSDGSIISMARSEDVRGAEIGTSDVLFQLRAVGSESETRRRAIRIYSVVYELTDHSGRKMTVGGKIRVSKKPAQKPPPRFWVKKT